MTTQIQHTDRDDAATVTTHHLQMARYSESYASSNDDAPDPSSIDKLAARIDALREQVTFAKKALALSEAELDAIAGSLAGRNT